MSKKFNVKEFLNIKILTTSEDLSIKGGEDQKQKVKQKIKQKIKQKKNLMDNLNFQY